MVGTERLKNDKYEIKCTKGTASEVIIEITISSEKLSDKEMKELSTQIRRIAYAFDRVDSVSSRYGTASKKNNDH